ncbi:septum formation initiator family protein [Eubacteriales bacterium OttesenSCG-928-N13]|nr:septum formation initiator family protein [Eubacteriales bacterium OttesenSCG-928-N13]
MTRKRTVKPRFWLMLMGILLVVFLGVYVSQTSYMNHQDDQIAQLQQQRDDAANENAELERKINFSKTDAYVERVAREEFGLIKPGEIRFVAGAETSTQPAATTPPTEVAEGVPDNAQ